MTEKTERTLTKDDVTQIIRTSSRCTQATLRAFGIEGYPHYGPGCLNYLTRAGFRLENVKEARGKSLANFNFDWGKKYLIFTKGHAMAHINGFLVDTSHGGHYNHPFESVWIVKKVHPVVQG